MSVVARAALALCAALYLAAVILPCPPSAIADGPRGGDRDASLSIYCPCHATDATPNGGVGADWQGPRSAGAGALPTAALSPPPPLRTAVPSRGIAPPPPIPIA